MIDITIGGKPLYIPQDTVLVLEQTSNIESDGITADIVWTFELPAKPNQRVLGAVQYTYVSNRRRYDCELLVDGIPISRGQLYVQTATDEKRLECGIVANAFGVGFGDKMLRENDYGPNLVISENEENHKEGWRQFLRKSLDGQSVYKFFLFADSKFYSDNDDYGMYKGQTSPLYSSRSSEDIATGFVNRLFYKMAWRVNGDGTYTQVPSTIIEEEDSTVRGCRLFNTTSTTGQNGYCFAPALRLDWLVRKVFQNAALSVGGSFFTDFFIRRLYAQSMCAMDGSSIQYGANGSLSIQSVFGESEDGSTQPFVCTRDNKRYTSFKWKYGGGPRFDFSFQLPQDGLMRGGTYDGEEKFSVVDEIIALAIVPASGGSLPTWRMKVPTGSPSKDYDPFIYGDLKTLDEIKKSLTIADSSNPSSVYKVSDGCAHFNYTAYILGVGFNRTENCIPLNKSKCMLIQLTPSAGNTRNNLSDGYVRGSLLPMYVATHVTCAHYNWGTVMSGSTEYNVRLVKLKVASSKGDISVRWKDCWYLMKVKLTAYGQMEKLYDYEDLPVEPINLTDPTLNIFSRLLEWRQHVPHLSNSEFIGLICQTFGLSLYVNPMTRQAQLNLFSDTLKGGVLDISQWVSGKERLEYTLKRYSVTFSPTAGENKASEAVTLDEVNSKSSLPSALLNLNKHVFVRNEATFRHAEQSEDKTFSWEVGGGDSRPLTAGAEGADESEDVNIDCNMPNMAFVDEKIGTVAQKYLCQIEADGCSTMLDKEYKGEFPLILQQYVGRRVLVGTGGSYYIEDANPTAYHQGGNKNVTAINLSAAGERSIGELYLRPLYNLLGDCDRYRITAHLPAWMLVKVMATLQPQQGAVTEQQRWIMVDGLKILPVKISSELGNRPNITCVIEGIAPHTEF